MSDQANIDIDYEHMDDLPLYEHFEWHLLQIDNVDADNLNEDQSEWQAA